MAVEEVEVEAVGSGVEAAAGDNGGGEEGEDEQRRRDVDGHGFF